MQERSAILQTLSYSHQRSAEQYLLSARSALAKLTSISGLLDDVSLKREPGTFTRNLVFADKQLSVWALVWAPSSYTPIHDHHCSCCLTVLSGTIRETWYSAINQNTVTKIDEHYRRSGYVASMMPSGPNIHQMANVGSSEAVSLHIYGYDHRNYASSMLHEYQPAVD